MNKMNLRLVFWNIVIVSLILKSCKSTEEGPVKVEVKFEDGMYQLYRRGEPYYIKGAGLEFGDIKSLAEAGANSFRTWRTENKMRTAQEVLDEAHKYGLTVTMGLEIAKERHGFDYNDSVKVKEQFKYIKGEVLKYKDHPALLAWGIGNELNLHYTNNKVWDAVNDIAKMIHEVDGNHPATTMLAGIGKGEVEYIEQNCPDIDFLSIQMYGDIINLAMRIKDAGYEGPYIVTEWGATGHWEVDSTEWGIQIEQTSTEKSEVIKERWEKAITANPAHSLGSYVFLWGQKQERTPTWYGFFLETGEKTEQVGTMQFLWTGKYPEKRAPGIKEITLNGKTRFNNIYLSPDEDFNLKVDVINHTGEELKIKTEILPDIQDYYADGGDFEERPESLSKFEFDNTSEKILLHAPSKSGPYRVFVYLLDNYNQTATANVAFFVK